MSSREKMIGLYQSVGIAAVLAMSFGLVVPVANAQDECGTAVVVTAGVPIAFNTTTATPSANPPSDAQCADSSLLWNSSRDVWFKWVAPANGIATFSTCSVGGFDTSMALYQGACDALVQIACNGDAFDSTGCQDLHAQIANFQVTGGTTYFIRVGGFDGGAGAATLSVNHVRVGAWGSNANGQLRAPMTTGTVLKTVGGGEHALALRSDGAVIAWGANQLNQSNVPSSVGTAVDIAAGGAHSLAIRSNGTVAAWGRNSSGQCNVPAILTGAVSIAAGGSHSLAARASGAVLAWGSNTFQQSTVPASLSAVVQVASGEIHSVARRSNGTVAAWGGNANGQTSVPATLTDAVDLAGGGYHNLAIRANGSVVAWGLNDFAQCTVPAGLTGVVDVAAGRYHSLALRADGTITAWGYNATNQIDVPANLGPSSQIGAGAFFSLATRDGCPHDPSKIEPGLCGCGSPDIDSDSDGAPDCNDECPNDPSKTESGQCGCGIAETDTDGDGVADCNDDCPSDPSKTVAGQCGCGVPETDTDGDGVADCNDLCPTVAELAGPVTYYADVDQDGFGDAGVSQSICAPAAPAGFVTDSSDCNDALVAYVDADADGFGISSFAACGGAPVAGDCDDALASAYPGAAEICANDGIDNDCDGEAGLDAEATDSVAYFIDADGDGFGALIATGVVSCTPVAGSVPNNGDCDDTRVLFRDADFDSFGTTERVGCGGVRNSDDCDDTTNLVNPDADEFCADLAVDNNCDGVMTAEEAIDSVRWSPDLDQDGFGVGGNLAVWSCEPIAGSAPNGDDCDDTLVMYADGDLDGFGAGAMIACGGVASSSDCNDAEAAVFPGAPEACADLAVDNDCDGVATDAEATDSIAYFVDGDQDGFGAGAATMSCAPIAGSVTDSSDCDDAAVLFADGDLDGFGAGAPAACGVATDTDCNDAEALVFPGAPEACADLAVDNDCDGDTSEIEAADSVAYFVDGDGDGFGGGAATMSCAPIAGSVTNGSDCDDLSSAVFPGALENCANLAVDNDCDGSVSDWEAVDAMDLYADADRDGFGGGDLIRSCSIVDGFVLDNSDCDDTTALYFDYDQDGYGAGPAIACGGVPTDTDCDDELPEFNPGRSETCGDLGFDNNCDGITDRESDAVDAVAYYLDADQDGFGAGAATLACSPIAGSSLLDGDCDDAAVIYADADQDGFGAGAPVACGGVASDNDCDDGSNLVFPGAGELCADLAVDNDCDGEMTDAEATDSVAYFVDGDADGFGAGASTMSCSAIAGSVADSTDCDDGSNLVFPGAGELCADLAVDNDCDGEMTDAEATDSVAYFVDGDQDGFGAGASTMSCSAIAGSVADSTDCDDGSNLVFPGAGELCADLAVDNDCDGEMTDAEATDSIAYFVDGDQDGFGAGAATMSCSAIAGSVTDSSDCDDAAVLHADADQDGFGAGAPVACGGVASSTDCDDGSNLVFPGAGELCADLAVDNDCDGEMTDAEATDSLSYCVDGDGDGFGAGAITRSCTAIPGHVTNGTDCDDLSNLVFPGAVELCADLAIDNDCDGEMTDAEATDSLSYCVDGDGDGFGAGAITRSCTAIPGHVTNGTDCDDLSNLVFPGAVELCADLAVDNDCDGSTAEDEATDRTTFYGDADQDGAGDAAVTALACTQPEGFVTAAGDDCPANGQLLAGVTYFADSDADGFGNLASTTSVCETSAPAGFAADSTDCDDGSNLVFPGAVELCADLAVDNDCDGSTAEDEATDRTTFYGDADQDGAGDAAVTALACTAPAGFVSNANDLCPDNGALVSPATWYADADGDGSGDAATTQTACAQPAGYVATAGDGCPADSAKTEPGACGCGVADADGDADGVADCNDNCTTVANPDQRDCNSNGTGDACELAAGTAEDCNANGLLDACDLASGASTDLDASGRPDDCEFVVGGSGYASIQAAIDDAPNGTLIKVAPGVHAPFTAVQRGVTLQSIGGNAVTFIDGANQSRPIELVGRVAERFVIRGFTVRNGRATEGAGARIENADPLIEGCVFADNIATVRGGALHAVDSAADFAATSFLRNAAETGGAISNVNSATLRGTLTISSGLFRDNIATADGGAISNAARLFLLECTLEVNTAGGVGGGVRQLETGETTLFTSRFCRNEPDNISGPFTAVGDNILSQDCNANGICDADEIAAGDVADCNANGLPDSCDLTEGTAGDCNTNGIPDSCDIAAGTSTDVDANGIPDECKPDCNANGIPDAFEIASGGAADCNTNGIPDSCDIAANAGLDCNANGSLDSCELASGAARDCNANGVIDSCDIAGGAADSDADGRLDRCEFNYGDFNLNGTVNGQDLAILLNNWGLATGLGDANADGEINGQDLAILLSWWGVPLP